MQVHFEKDGEIDSTLRTCLRYNAIQLCAQFQIVELLVVMC